MNFFNRKPVEFNGKMTEDKYKQLESLLDDLKSDVGHSICIIPGYMHDSPYVGVYGQDGKLLLSEIGPDLKTVIADIKDKLSKPD